MHWKVLARCAFLRDVTKIYRFFWGAIALTVVSCAASPKVEPVASRRDPIVAPLAPHVSPSPASSDVTERTVTTPRVSYVFRASRLSNLLYELDCLSNLTRCSHVAYEELWKKDLGMTDGDADALKAWHDLRLRYSGNIRKSDEDTKPPLPLPSSGRSIAMRMRLAGYGATSEKDYFSRLSLFLDPSDVDAARKILARFSSRFDHFWNERQPDLARGLDEYAALVARPDVTAILASAQTFFDPQFTDGATETFDLIARTDHSSPDSGEQLLDHSVIEVRPGEHPSHRFDVVMHELFHSWFAASPYAKQNKLVTSFASSPDPLAVPAYGLLNEVLATDFGNGLIQRAVEPKEFERRFAKPGALYNDDGIDRVAKKMLPILETQIAAKKSVFDDDFVPGYLGAVDSVFPNGAPPSLYLRTYVCAYDNAFGSAAEHLDEVARASSVRSTDSLDAKEALPLFTDYAQWGGVILTKPDQLDALKKWTGVTDDKTLKAIRAQAAKKIPFVWMTHRPKAGVLFILVAPDGVAMKTLVDHLVALPAFHEGATTFP
jgi:hypothetical protein